MPSTKVITGTFQFPDGTPAAGCLLWLRLSPGSATVVGTGQIAPVEVAITLDNNGSIPANTRVWGVDDLSPVGCAYNATLSPADGGGPFYSAVWSIAGVSPINLNTLVSTSSMIAYPNAVLQNPSSVQTINGFGINVPSVSNIQYANQQVGADLTAQIQAAGVALGANPGVIYVTASGTMSGPLTLASGHDLVGVGAGVVITMASNAASISLGGSNKIANLIFAATFPTQGSLGQINGDGVAHVTLQDLQFSGGGHNIIFHNSFDINIQNTKHYGLTVPGASCILMDTSCNYCKIDKVYIAGFTPAGTGQFNTFINLTNCRNMDVTNCTVRDINNSGHSGGIGLGLYACQYVNVVGGQYSNNPNLDGLGALSTGGVGSTYINFTGVNASFNGGGNVGGHANGDGLDLFECAYIRVSDCVFIGNGTYSQANNNIDCYSSYDVQMVNVRMEAAGNNNIQVSYSQHVKMIGCEAILAKNIGCYIGISTGTCNTVGTAVTFATGTFGFPVTFPAGSTIIIAGVTYAIVSVNSSTSITLATSAGTQTGAAFIVPSLDVQIIGGNFRDNGAGVNGTIAGIITQTGITVDGRCDAYLSGVVMQDTHSSGQTQLYGLLVAANATANVENCTFTNNATAPIADLSGKITLLTTTASAPPPNLGLSNGSTAIAISKGALHAGQTLYTLFNQIWSRVGAVINQINATGLTANYNSGSAATVYNAFAISGAVVRISWAQAITTAGSVSSTFPSLTLAWTDAAGTARTKQLVATSTANTNGVESDGTAVITVLAGAAVTITSASYAASSANSMVYALSVTTEVL